MTERRKAMSPEQLEEASRDFAWDLILFAVAEHFKVDATKVVARCRLLHVDFARAITMYLYREMTTCTWMEIGKVICRSHATVISGHGAIERRAAQSRAFARELDRLRASILARPEAKHSTVLNRDQRETEAA